MCERKERRKVKAERKKRRNIENKGSMSQGIKKGRNKQERTNWNVGFRYSCELPCIRI
jgi:hypothetical protein